MFDRQYLKNVLVMPSVEYRLPSLSGPINTNKGTYSKDLKHTSPPTRENIGSVESADDI